VANRVSLRRVILLSILALVAAATFVPSASAGGIRDWEPCPDSAGELICPVGQVGIPYSIKFRAVEEPPCRPGDDTWHIINDAPPTGLTLALDGTLSGMPIQAGTFSFWVEMRLPDIEGVCNGTADTSQRRFTITINPGTLPPPPPPPLPRLIIGPESVAPGTVGTPYMAAMTANLPDAKTWSLTAGTLPTGLNLGASDGVISGMPAVPGSFTFTVQGLIADGRSDTKTLTLEVRDRLTLVGSGDLETRVVRTQVGVQFDGGLFATGGFGAYLWSVEGDLPPGLTLDVDGSIIGSPEEWGTYRFTVAVTDEEGRRAAYATRMIVAKRLAIKTKRLKPAKVGRFLIRKVATLGGVGPKTVRIMRGPLPRGVRFDRFAGIFVGSPTKIGTWRIRVQVIDSLGVKATGFVVLVVRK
jgi:hypothetical protein